MIVQWFISHPKEEELIMSARNGDKSRFHRERKQKIARRKRTEELLHRARGHAKSGGALSGGKAQRVAE